MGKKSLPRRSRRSSLIAMECVVVGELLTFEVDLVEQVLVDSGLDVEDRESHQPL